MSKLALAAAVVVLGTGAVLAFGGRSPRGVAAGTPAPTDTASVTLAIRGMTCGSCSTTARLALQQVPGVYRAAVSYDSASAVVRYNPATTSPSAFIARLKEMTGYEARVTAPAGRLPTTS